MLQKTAIFFVGLAMFTASPVLGQTPDAPRISFESVPDFIKMPEGLYMGEAMGVATNSQGEFYVFTRSGEATRLFQFDGNGNYMREIGYGLYGMAFAHAVRVDADDNVWVVDEGTDDMVIKFNPEGRVLMTIGRRPEAQQMRESPERGAPRPGARPYNLNFKFMIDGIGAPWAVCISPGPHQYLYSSNSNTTGNSKESYDNAGEIYKMELDGTIIGRFGTGGKQLGEFGSVHAIDCRNPDELLVAEITTWRVQKILLDPRLTSQ